MITRKQLGVLTFAIFLFGALPGCAAYRKCGPVSNSLDREIAKSVAAGQRGAGELPSQRD